MSSGKIGAQCGHAVGMIYGWYFSQFEKGVWDEETKNKVACFEAWQKDSYRKVVLRADEKEWTKIKTELDYFLVIDAGLTELNPHTETAISLLPMKKSEAPKIIKRLQVLK